MAIGSVGTANLQDRSVSPMKLFSRDRGQVVGLGGIALSSGSGITNLAKESNSTDLPGLSVSLTTSGRPVYLVLIPEEGHLGGSIRILPNSQGFSHPQTESVVYYYRNGKEVGNSVMTVKQAVGLQMLAAPLGAFARLVFLRLVNLHIPYDSRPEVAATISKLLMCALQPSSFNRLFLFVRRISPCVFFRFRQNGLNRAESFG